MIQKIASIFRISPFFSIKKRRFEAILINFYCVAESKRPGLSIKIEISEQATKEKGW